MSISHGGVYMAGKDGDVKHVEGPQVTAQKIKDEAEKKTAALSEKKNANSKAASNKVNTNDDTKTAKTTKE